MDPFTHALTSVALDRAGLRRVSRSAMAILVVSGVGADLDLLTYFSGAGAYFHYHYALLHSILSSAILVFLIAAAFWKFDRRAKLPPLRFSRVFLLCLIGVGIHLLLDFLGAEGVQLLWPFRMRWFSADWLPEIDPWIIGILLVGCLLPALFRLITEEIGGRKKTQTVSAGALVALVLMAIYIGGRAMLHHTAMQTLMAHDYHGAAPLVAGAFPDSTSPLLWRGVVATTNTIEVVSVPLGPAGTFDAMSSLTHYKPPSSPVLNAAHRAPLAMQFLHYARFPLADLQTIPGGAIITLRDLRYEQDSPSPANMRAVIQLDNALRLQDEHMEFPSVSSPR
ncbi:MAG TPA: metal-dependent hydrolase [Candidatus Acidoferrales bacterium]|nr:metal-dependent hydrolase [Candidatus Acidoferrales bacterium]